MTTYVLIPGAGGSAWYWHRVVPRLSDLGHDVVAVDLPADDDRYGVSDYADIVVQAIGERRDIVLVAQSLGGFSAPLVCDRTPVSLVVLVNAMIPAPGESGGAWWGNTSQAEAMSDNDRREGRSADESTDGEFDAATYFLHDLPSEVLAESEHHARDQSGTPFERPLPLDAWPDVPTKVISGRDDRFFPVDFQCRVAEERLGITPDVIAGGHLLALSQPDALVTQLEQYRVAAGVGVDR